MWIIVPLAPIVIAIICLALGVFGELKSNMDTINSVLIALVVIIFVVIAIYNLTRPISVTRRIFSTIACALFGTASGFTLTFLTDSLAQIEFGLLGLFEFAFTLIMGGSICLLIVMGCIWACLWFSD